MTDRQLPTRDKASLVNRLWVVQSGRCFHCGEAMLMGVASNHGRGWSREHIFPVSRGGRNAGNVVLAHRKCNSARGNPEPSEDEIERARAIFAVMGLAPFPDVCLPTAKPMAKMADVWPIQARNIHRGHRQQLAAVGHDVVFGEFRNARQA